MPVPTIRGDSRRLNSRGTLEQIRRENGAKAPEGAFAHDCEKSYERFLGGRMSA